MTAVEELRAVWRCDITGNPVGTDTRLIGAPPCACQGCRAADALEAALSERDAALAEIERLTPLAAAYDYLEAPDAVDWKARVTALEKALEDFARRIDNDGTASQIVSADEIRALLSAKGGET